MSPGLSMNRRLNRDRNSEVRQSKEQIIADTPQRRIIESNQTETNWLDLKNTGCLPSLNLKDQIDVGTTRKRQFGQGFVGASSKPAGFNRNEFNSTGEYTNNQKKGINEITIATGIGSSLLNTQTVKNESIKPILVGQIKPDLERPPLYVPSQRTQIKRD